MTIDPTTVGLAGEPRRISWDSKDALLYAVGIGAGHEDLPFTTENTIDVPHVVYPTFAVVAGAGGDVRDDSLLARIGSFDWAMLVHGSQAVTLHRPIPPAAEAVSVERIAAMYDKGNATVVVLETEVATTTGELLWTARSSAFIRGVGGWGGDRGPSGARQLPPDRSPDHEVRMATSRDQAFIYRLSGDRNPLHTDPSYAARAGFDRPILHGLCTYGFTARALLRSLCDDDVARFEHVEGRFAAPVWPGDELTVRVWLTADREAMFVTSVGDRAVIDQGAARWR